LGLVEHAKGHGEPAIAGPQEAEVVKAAKGASRHERLRIFDRLEVIGLGGQNKSEIVCGAGADGQNGQNGGCAETFHHNDPSHPALIFKAGLLSGYG
jgi:hypothetical protein